MKSHIREYWLPPLSAECQTLKQLGRQVDSVSG